VRGMEGILLALFFIFIMPAHPAVPLIYIRVPISVIIGILVGKRVAGIIGLETTWLETAKIVAIAHILMVLLMIPVLNIAATIIYLRQKLKPQDVAGLLAVFMAIYAIPMATSATITALIT